MACPWPNAYNSVGYNITDEIEFDLQGRGMVMLKLMPQVLFPCQVTLMGTQYYCGVAKWLHTQKNTHCWRASLSNPKYVSLGHYDHTLGRHEKMFFVFYNLPIVPLNNVEIASHGCHEHGEEADEKESSEDEENEEEEEEEEEDVEKGGKCRQWGMPRGKGCRKGEGKGTKSCSTQICETEDPFFEASQRSAGDLGTQQGTKKK